MSIPSASPVQHLGEWRPLADITPSALNPRRGIDQGKLEELAESIKAKGIIEPLIVRAIPKAKAGATLEIVAGERRWRAAKLAEQDTLPVIIRTLTDVEVLELMAIENSQRDDLHELEEAEGYLALMKADGAYTPAAIAAKIGKSTRYVERRLKLAQLTTEVKDEFLADHITAGHAELLSRLQPDKQMAALKACFDHLYGDDRERGCISVRGLDSWIKEHVRLAIEPKNPEIEVFPELGKLLEEPSTTAPQTLLQVHQQYGQQVKGVLGPNEYVMVSGKHRRGARCAATERAVVVLGADRGELVEICRTRSCKKHFGEAVGGPPKPTAPPARSTADIARDRRLKIWRQLKPVAIAEAGKRAATLTPGVLQVLAWAILRHRYNAGSHRRGTLTLADLVKASAELAAAESNDTTFATRIAKPLGMDLRQMFTKAAAGQRQVHARHAKRKPHGKKGGK